MIRIISFPAPLFRLEMSFIETENSVRRSEGACLTAIRMTYDDVIFIRPDVIGKIKLLRANFHFLILNITEQTCYPLHFTVCSSHSCVSTPYALVYTLETDRDKKEKEWVVCWYEGGGVDW
jgi:hypothetical protein